MNSFEQVSENGKHYRLVVKPTPSGGVVATVEVDD